MALRREPDAAGLRIHETRSLADGWEMLARHPGSFVVVEATSGNLDAVLVRLARLGRTDPLARAAVVADCTLGGLEWTVREAGAVWYTSSLREVGPLASIARRHLETAPMPARSLAEQLWATLPWGRD